MRPALYPLRFSPILKPILWGGEKICAFKGLPAGGDNIGESWEISDVRGSESQVSDGPLKGQTLQQIIETYQELFMGEKIYQRFGNQFPLLVKFIDAKQDLSIQVHPTDELARKRHQTNGKTEMWYVIEARHGAVISTGFNYPYNRQDVERHMAEHRLPELLNREKPEVGDVFFLPAGRVHAIGAGTFLVEIQQNSDVTYRLWDYDRTDKDGRKRELHTEYALDAIDYRPYSHYKTRFTLHRGERSHILDCPYFSSTLIDTDRIVPLDYQGLDSFIVWICLDGQASFTSQHKHKGLLRKGETLLFPACDQPTAVIPDGSVRLLEVYIN